MKTRIFTKTKLATSLSLMLGVGSVLPVHGADKAEEKIEVIQVTGIRGSLVKSMDIKRSSNGIVDAITSEDIGKFPDGNLAESLQRISGVSIDRSNGEGAKITVRGMGPEFNMVTLNGRQMPTVGGRAFDFSNIATDAVSTVEVYKTAKAELPTGGIGATVNMITARPFQNPGLQAVMGGKAVHETSVEDRGSKLTPELSGLFSNTFADDSFGFLISGSFQDRDNREESAAVDNWIPNVGTGTGIITNNNQRADGANWYPQNSGYTIKDNSRQRTNGQVVFQYAPTDTITSTLDYTYSKVETRGDFDAFGVWFNNGGSIVNGTINERGTYTQVAESGGDFATNVGRGESERENKSLGFNLEWQATENLEFTFDAHTSSALDRGVGLGNDAFLIIGNTFCNWCASVPGAGPSTAAIDVKSATFPASGIPIYDMTFVDGNGNPQAGLTAADIGSLFGGATQESSENDMDQFQLKGKWLNSGNGSLVSIDFGVARTEQSFKNTKAFSGLLPAGWWNWSAQYWPDELWSQGSTNGLLSAFGNSGNITQGSYYRADFDTILHGYETITDTFASCCFNESWPDEFKNADGTGKFWAGSNDSDARVNEVITSAFTQLTFEDEFNGMPINLVTGLRYEEAKISSQGLETPATNIIWSGGNEFVYEFGEAAFSDGDATTKQFLPSLDISLSVTDELITRFSFARSLTRPNIGDLRSTTDFAGAPKVGQRKIVSGNPGLSPYIADNFDLSAEYYYAEGSYVSVGYFKKIVDNFLVKSSSKVEIDGIRDVYAGPRAEEARAQLVAEGLQATDPNVFARINENMGVADLTTPIRPNSDDPLAVFDRTGVTNGETANLFGWEIAAQHLFGDSGFGAMVNATFVNGDVEADPDAIEQEFALPGMSDSANVSMFYQNDNWSARVSYNWRDQFFSGLDQHGSPVYTEAYSQVDANLSYTITENFTVFAEALNLTEETQRSFVRYEEQLLRANQYGARYNLGMRYKF